MDEQGLIVKNVGVLHSVSTGELNQLVKSAVDQRCASMVSRNLCVKNVADHPIVNTIK